MWQAVDTRPSLTRPVGGSLARIGAWAPTAGRALPCGRTGARSPLTALRSLILALWKRMSPRHDVADALDQGPQEGRGEGPVAR